MVNDAATVERKPRCGFIGLGSQGGPMAMRMIAAGFPTLVWARRPEALQPFKEAGAAIADSISDLARQVEHVGVCVVNDDDVQDVCGELILSLPRGARIAVHSTVHPETVRQVAIAAATFGIQVVDAPVSGGEPAAKAGKLTVMVGGDASAVELARPIFECFGSAIPHLGGLGAGQNAKLINNALLAANMAAADHALAAAQDLGIEKSALMDLLTVSSGRSFGLEVRGRLPDARAFSHGGPLLLKDLRLLQTLVADSEGISGLSRVAEPFLDQASGFAKN